MTDTSADKGLSADAGMKPDQPSDDGKARPKPGLGDYLSGDVEAALRQLSTFLPQDLIGGSIPYVAGAEEEAVWNAASQACGTEKVHYVYTISEGRCWYLASPSASMASNPDSWCPLAAALPGNSEYWDRETVYLYEQEGVASALRWDPDTGRMQVFLGASRTLLPRIQSMDANFVSINAESSQVYPWKNRQLMTEKLSRATAKTLVYTGIVINFILILVLAFQYILTNTIQGDLTEVKAKTKKASEDLLLKSYAALQSDTIKHMVRIQELLSALEAIDGTLVRYEVNGNSAEWEALVPPAFSEGRISGVNVQAIGREDDDRIRIKGRS